MALIGSGDPHREGRGLPVSLGRGLELLDDEKWTRGCFAGLDL